MVTGQWRIGSTQKSSLGLLDTSRLHYCQWKYKKRVCFWRVRKGTGKDKLIVLLMNKSENGCELKLTASERSKTMVCTELVIDRTGEMQRETTERFSHKTILKICVVQFWLQTDRVVCGDLYFALVQTAEAMITHGMRITAFVRMLWQNFPSNILHCENSFCVEIMFQWFL